MKKILVAAMLLLASLSHAVTAYPEPVQYDQGNGNKITVNLVGDESVNWAVTSDGYTLLKNNNGKLEYADLDSKGDLVLSGISANDQTKRNAVEKNFLKKVAKNLRFSKSQISIMNQLNRQIYKPNRALLGDGKTRATKKIVMLLAGFPDKAFTKTKTDFQNLMNQVGYAVGGATGSFKDFYLENSYNLTTFETTVAGPFTVSQNMSYYGSNSSYSHSVNADEMVTEVVNLANPTVDFSQFDNDLDGSVDAVYVIFAGYGEEAGAPAETIWSHASYINEITCDNKTISRYSCSPELSGNSGASLTNIGVICHEFGHVLGAPDFYDTNYDNTGDGYYPGTGKWDLMASGSWNNGGATPAHHNAYTKISVYNWATVTNLTSASTITMLNSAKNSNSFYKYSTTTANEYYLLENRQLVGFDASLPGHGMIIYHVDDDFIANNTLPYANSINTTSHQGMYPMAASHTVANGISLNTGSQVNTSGCPWPGTSSKTSFTDTTIPSSKSWAGANTGKPLTNITENTVDKTITFSFMENSTAFNAPTNLSYGLNGSTVTLNWTAPANKSLLGYNVYKDGTKLNTSVISTTTYTDNNVSGSHNYYTTAAYSNPDGESASSNTITVTIGDLGYWQKQNTGFTAVSRGINTISIADQNTVWAKAYDGSGGGASILEFTRTSDGGATWTPGSISTVDASKYGIGNIFASSSSTAYAAIYNTGSEVTSNGIYKTINGGTNWTKQTSSSQFAGAYSFPNFVHMFDANNGVCMGDPNGLNGATTGLFFEIYTTSNGGTAWTRVSSTNIPASISGEWGTVDCYDAIGDFICFGTTKGRVYKSTNKGLTWSVYQTAPSGKPITRISLHDLMNGIAVYNDGTSSAPVYKYKRTTDGGANWADLNATGLIHRLISPVRDHASGWLSVSPESGSMGSSYSLDNGLSWIALDTDVQYTEIEMLNRNAGWAGGFNTSSTEGGIFKSTQAIADLFFVSSIDDNKSDKILYLSQNYPNPFNPVTTISFTLAKNAAVNLSVYNAKGEIVKTLASGNHEAGSHSIDFNAAGINSGVYFYKLTTPESSITKKMLLVK